MNKYILAYYNVNMAIEFFPFVCKESELSKDIQLNYTYYYDDIVSENHFENIDSFLKKVGVRMFEVNESFKIIEIKEHIFQELE